MAAINLHIENARSMPDMFKVSPEQFAIGLERNADVRDLIVVTFGEDDTASDDSIRQADVLAGCTLRIDGLAKRAPSLKFIQAIRAGIDSMLPLCWLPDGVRLCTAAGAHAEKCEQAAALGLLALNARLPEILTNQRRRSWKQIFTSTTHGRTAGIVGVGNIGGRAAKQAKELGMYVLGVRQSRVPHQYVDEMFPPEGLAEVLTRSDILVLNTALTSATRALIGEKEIRLMKRGAALLNMARGGVIDTDALVRALRDGHLSGAFIDVAPTEPLPPDAPLWDVPNLMITPHVLSDDLSRFIPNSLEILFENIRRLHSSKPLLNEVDRSKEY